MSELTIQSRIASILPVVAYAVGYDINDNDNEDARGFIQALVEAGIEDMQRSGVSEATILESKIVISALTIFVNDNLNMSAGKYITSLMYIANVDKIREGLV